MLAEEVQIVCLVAAAEASMLHVLLLVLLVQRLLLLLWYWAREMREGIREVVTGEAAPVRRHCEAAVVVATIRVCVGEVDPVDVRAGDGTMDLLGCLDEARESRGYPRAVRTRLGW